MIEWSNCEYVSSSLGVAYCNILDDFCIKGKCQWLEEEDETEISN